MVEAHLPRVRTQVSLTMVDIFNLRTLPGISLDCVQDTHSKKKPTGPEPFQARNISPTPIPYESRNKTLVYSRRRSKVRIWLCNLNIAMSLNWILFLMNLKVSFLANDTTNLDDLDLPIAKREPSPAPYILSRIT